MELEFFSSRSVVYPKKLGCGLEAIIEWPQVSVVFWFINLTAILVLNFECNLEFYKQDLSRGFKMRSLNLNSNVLLNSKF